MRDRIELFPIEAKRVEDAETALYDFLDAYGADKRAMRGISVLIDAKIALALQEYAASNGHEFTAMLLKCNAADPAA